MRGGLPGGYVAVVDVLPDAALLYDRNGLVHMDAEGLRRLRTAGGYGEVVHLVELVLAPDRPAVRDAAATALSGDTVASVKLAWQGPGTPVRLVPRDVSPIELDGRRYLQLVARDLGEQVEAEQALARPDSRFRAPFDHSPLGWPWWRTAGSSWSTSRCRTALPELMAVRPVVGASPLGGAGGSTTRPPT